MGISNLVIIWDFCSISRDSRELKLERRTLGVIKGKFVDYIEDILRIILEYLGGI